MLVTLVLPVQSVQAAWPPTEKVPPEHSCLLSVLVSVQKYPDGQLEQRLKRKRETEWLQNEINSQTERQRDSQTVRQTSIRSCTYARTRTHAHTRTRTHVCTHIHTVCPLSENVPGWHVMTSSEFLFGQAKPGWHSLHVTDIGPEWNPWVGIE